MTGNKKFEIEFKPRAVKDIESLSSSLQTRILDRISELGDNLKGDVKRLTSITPEYRLRVGEYRVLFEVEENAVIVYRVRHRREVYR